MNFDDLVGVAITNCSECGTERWYGYGPCDNCGAFLPDSPDMATPAPVEDEK